MNWADGAILFLLALGTLIAVGIGRKLERKLDACLNLFRALTEPKGQTIGQLAESLRGAKAEMEKTVYHLTPEHDAKVLGENDD